MQSHLEIKKEVDNAFEKVFSGNDRINEGYTDNHCSKKTLDYFVGIYNQDEKAIKRQDEILAKLEEEDFSDLEKTINGMLNA
ncbi:hypothetical protein DSE64_08000 [Campylobacter lari]|nr:hypothetical protein [Campylobacter lari]